MACGGNDSLKKVVAWVTALLSDNGTCVSGLLFLLCSVLGSTYGMGTMILVQGEDKAEMPQSPLRWTDWRVHRWGSCQGC